MASEDRDYSSYVAAWRRRAVEGEKALAARKRRALRRVKTLASLLARDFGVTRVVLFGSLAWGKFRGYSDIGLAVEGLAHERYLEAYGRLEEASEFHVDLVTLESAGASLAARILEEGVVLLDT